MCGVLLPPAYVVRREGNVLTRVCPSINLSVHGGGGYPYPIMLCNISQNAMGQTPGGGYPAQGGTLPRGVPCWGGTLPRGRYPGRVPRGPDQDRGVPCRGGTQAGYTPLAGYPHRTQPGQDGGGYPVRTTEGVVTTRRAVCLLRSRRRTFLCNYSCLQYLHCQPTCYTNWWMTKLLKGNNTNFPLPTSFLTKNYVQPIV